MPKLVNTIKEGITYSQKDINDIFTIKTIYNIYLSRDLNFKSLYFHVSTNYVGTSEIGSFVKKCYPQISTLIYYITLANSVYFDPEAFNPNNPDGLNERQKTLILDYKLLIVDKLISIYRDYKIVALFLLEKLTNITKKFRLITGSIQSTISILRANLNKCVNTFAALEAIFNECIEKNIFTKVELPAEILNKRQIDNIIRISKEKLLEIDRLEEPNIEVITQSFVEYLHYNPYVMIKMISEKDAYPILSIVEDKQYFENLKREFNNSSTSLSGDPSQGHTRTMASQTMYYGGITKKSRKSRKSRKRKTQKRRQKTHRRR
jgi:hypothetical protein